MVLHGGVGLLQLEMLPPPMDKPVELLGWLALEDYPIEVLGLVKSVLTVVAVSLTNWSLELGCLVVNPHHWHPSLTLACEIV